jgi:hypothetical protein
MHRRSRDLAKLDTGGACLAKTTDEHLAEEGTVAGKDDFVCREG